MKLPRLFGPPRTPAPVRHRHSQRRTQLPRILRRIYYAAGLLLALTVLGTGGFYLAGGDQANFSDALYMTLITITTVGYGEVVPIDGIVERLFAGLIALAGFGAVACMRPGRSRRDLGLIRERSAARRSWTG